MIYRGALMLSKLFNRKKTDNPLADLTKTPTPDTKTLEKNLDTTPNNPNNSPRSEAQSPRDNGKLSSADLIKAIINCIKNPDATGLEAFLQMNNSKLHHDHKAIIRSSSKFDGIETPDLQLYVDCLQKHEKKDKGAEKELEKRSKQLPAPSTVIIETAPELKKVRLSRKITPAVLPILNEIQHDEPDQPDNPATPPLPPEIESRLTKSKRTKNPLETTALSQKTSKLAYCCRGTVISAAVIVFSIAFKLILDYMRHNDQSKGSAPGL